MSEHIEHYDAVSQHRLLLALVLSETPMSVKSVFEVLTQAESVLERPAYEILARTARAFLRTEAMTPETFDASRVRQIFQDRELGEL